MLFEKITAEQAVHHSNFDPKQTAADQRSEQAFHCAEICRLRRMFEENSVERSDNQVGTSVHSGHSAG